MVFALFFILLLSPASSFADFYNPLVSYKEQLKNLRRDCRDRPFDQECERLEKKLKDEMVELQGICKKNPENERCGAVMKVERVNPWVAFCLKNPYAKKCVGKRLRHRRREKLKAKYCAKNPDAKRCQTRQVISKRDLKRHCKQNPHSKKCVYLERRNTHKEPVKQVVKNTF